MNHDGKPLPSYAFGISPSVARALRALQPLLRTGKLSRFRLLDVACSREQERLLQVLATPAGPVITGLSRAVLLASRPAKDPADAVTKVPRKHRQPKVELLDTLPESATWAAQCRCGIAPIPVSWIRRQMEQGRRRVVWPDTQSTSNAVLE